MVEIMKSLSFSFIIDEITDLGTKKSLVVIVRYFDEVKNKVRDKFLLLIELEECTAESISQKLLTFLNKNEIPIKNLIGLEADNASVMMGHISGVKARLKAVIPDLYVLGCSCHSFHLCASAA